MFKRESNFTLIELIVVIAVLGILAAIVLPNISSMTDEANAARVTADMRNVQTALDMYKAKATDINLSEPILQLNAKDVLITATKELKDDGTFGALSTGELGTAKAIDLSKLQPTYLRKAPKYVVNNALVAADADATTGQLKTSATIPWTTGKVVYGVMTDATGKSTAILRAYTIQGATPAISIVR